MKQKQQLPAIRLPGRFTKYEIAERELFLLTDGLRIVRRDFNSAKFGPLTRKQVNVLAKELKLQQQLVEQMIAIMLKNGGTNDEKIPITLPLVQQALWRALYVHSRAPPGFLP